MHRIGQDQNNTSTEIIRKQNFTEELKIYFSPIFGYNCENIEVYQMIWISLKNQSFRLWTNQEF